MANSLDALGDLHKEVTSAPFAALSSRLLALRSIQPRKPLTQMLAKRLFTQELIDDIREEQRTAKAGDYCVWCLCVEVCVCICNSRGDAIPRVARTENESDNAVHGSDSYRNTQTRHKPIHVHPGVPLRSRPGTVGGVEEGQGAHATRCGGGSVRGLRKAFAYTFITVGENV